MAVTAVLPTIPAMVLALNTPLAAIGGLFLLISLLTLLIVANAKSKAKAAEAKAAAAVIDEDVAVSDRAARAAEWFTTVDAKPADVADDRSELTVADEEDETRVVVGSVDDEVEPRLISPWERDEDAAWMDIPPVFTPDAVIGGSDPTGGDGSEVLFARTEDYLLATEHDDDPAADDDDDSTDSENLFARTEDYLLVTAAEAEAVQADAGADNDDLSVELTETGIIEQTSDDTPSDMPAEAVTPEPPGSAESETAVSSEDAVDSDSVADVEVPAAPVVEELLFAVLIEPADIAPIAVIPELPNNDAADFEYDGVVEEQTAVEDGELEAATSDSSDDHDTDAVGNDEDTAEEVVLVAEELLVGEVAVQEVIADEDNDAQAGVDDAVAEQDEVDEFHFELELITELEAEELVAEELEAAESADATAGSADEQQEDESITAAWHEIAAHAAQLRQNAELLDIEGAAHLARAEQHEDAAADALEEYEAEIDLAQQARELALSCAAQASSLYEAAADVEAQAAADSAEDVVIDAVDPEPEIVEAESAPIEQDLSSTTDETGADWVAVLDDEVEVEESSVEAARPMSRRERRKAVKAQARLVAAQRREAERAQRDADRAAKQASEAAAREAAEQAKRDAEQTKQAEKARKEAASQQAKDLKAAEQARRKTTASASHEQAPTTATPAVAVPAVDPVSQDDDSVGIIPVEVIAAAAMAAAAAAPGAGPVSQDDDSVGVIPVEVIAAAAMAAAAAAAGEASNRGLSSYDKERLAREQAAADELAEYLATEVEEPVEIAEPDPVVVEAAQPPVVEPGTAPMWPVAKTVTFEEVTFEEVTFEEATVEEVSAESAQPVAADQSAFEQPTFEQTTAAPVAYDEPAVEAVLPQEMPVADQQTFEPSEVPPIVAEETAIEAVLPPETPFVAEQPTFEQPAATSTETDIAAVETRAPAEQLQPVDSQQPAAPAPYQLPPEALAALDIGLPTPMPAPRAYDTPAPSDPRGTYSESAPMTKEQKKAAHAEERELRRSTDKANKAEEARRKKLEKESRKSSKRQRRGDKDAARRIKARQETRAMMRMDDKELVVDENSWGMPSQTGAPQTWTAGDDDFEVTLEGPSAPTPTPVGAGITVSSVEERRAQMMRLTPVAENVFDWRAAGLPEAIPDRGPSYADPTAMDVKTDVRPTPAVETE